MKEGGKPTREWKVPQILATIESSQDPQVRETVGRTGIAEPGASVLEVRSPSTV